MKESKSEAKEWLKALGIVVGAAAIVLILLLIAGYFVIESFAQWAT